MRNFVLVIEDVPSLKSVLKGREVLEAVAEEATASLRGRGGGQALEEEEAVLIPSSPLFLLLLYYVLLLQASAAAAAESLHNFSLFIPRRSRAC